MQNESSSSAPPSRPIPPNISPSEIAHRFDYHKVNEGQQNRINLVRTEFKRLAEAVVSAVPHGRELSLVLTKLEEASFYAVAAIARQPNNLDREERR